MGPSESDDTKTGHSDVRGDKVLFWRVFWALAATEALGLTWWLRERLQERLSSTLLIIVLVPILVLGHVNVFPASLAARLWRRKQREASD